MPRTGPHDSISLTLGRTTVHFTWDRDRWTHEILFADGTSWRSVEGSEPGGDPRWPASPVVVELSRLDTAPWQAILGVGSAGRSHFSASMTWVGGDDDGLRFEIACRVNERPVRLGSTYQGPSGFVCVEPVALPSECPATVEWAYVLDPEGLSPQAGSKVTAPPHPGD